MRDRRRIEGRWMPLYTGYIILQLMFFLSCLPSDNAQHMILNVGYIVLPASLPSHVTL